MEEQELRAKNERMRSQLKALKEQGSYAQKFRGQMAKFVEESKHNISQMNERITTETNKHKEQLHAMNSAYESTLRTQIELLNQNKVLTRTKEEREADFSKELEHITAAYEAQIKTFEAKVHVNVKKIKELSGGNLMQRLLKNERFRTVMLERGCPLQALQKQGRLQQIGNQVEEVDKQIEALEERAKQLDQEKNKMMELIDTMKELLQNMVKEKANIVKQNSILKEKLKQSEELIGRLLGNEE